MSPILSSPTATSSPATQSSSSGQLPAGAWLIDALRRQPGRTRVASSCGARRTAGEIATGAEAIARGLVNAGLKPGGAVILWMGREPDVVAAVIGVLRGGGAWLAIDPSQGARAERQRQDAPDALLIHGREPPPEAHRGGSLSLGDLLRTPDGPSAVEPGDDAPAYVVFTSGSTGRPKGAVNTRAGLVWLLTGWHDAKILTAGRVMLAQSSLAFDMSVLQLLLPVIADATVALIAPGLERDAPALAAACDDLGVTDVLCPPTSWRLLRASGWRPRQGLRLTLGAERVSRDVLEDAERCGVVVWTGWGVSEASACVTLGPLTSTTPITLGHPVPGTLLRVVADDGATCAVGEPGELWIGGVAVGLGYLGSAKNPGEQGFLRDSSGVRWYRTGDQGALLADGQVRFLGRRDDQLKVRGYRIEPDEVEAALRRHADVVEAAVHARPGPSGHDILVAWLVLVDNTALAPRAQRDALATQLPEWMLPSVWHHVAALPTTRSGKIDRRALRSPPDPASDVTRGGGHQRDGGRADADRTTATPGTDPRETVTALFARALAMPDVAPDDDFFLLGGDSLGAAQLLAALRHQAALDVPLAQFWQRPTPAGLAAAAKPWHDVAAQPARVGASDAAMTPGQRQLLLLQSLRPADITWHVGLRIELTGPLRAQQLTDAVAALQRRHGGLRTTLDLDTLRQQRHAELAIPWRRIDLVGAADQDRKILHLVERTCAARFDLARQAPLRATLMRLSADRHLLVLVAHHTALDGKSAALLITDLAAALAGREISRPDTDVQALGDWSAVQDHTDAAAWWREALHGFPAPGALPARPGTDSGAGALQTTLTAGDWAALRARARSRRATPHMALMAAWGAWLSEALGEPRIVVATVTEGRDTPALHHLVAHVANTVLVPLHFRATGGTDMSSGHGVSLAEAVDATRDAMVAAAAHASVPFDVVVRAAGLSGRTPARTCVLLQPTLHAQLRAGALTLHPTLLPAAGAAFDLGIEGEQRADGCLRLSWTWRRDVAADDDVQASVAAFHAWLSARLADDDAPKTPARLPWDSRAERALLADAAVVDARVQSRSDVSGTLRPTAFVVTRAAEAVRLPAASRLPGIWTAPVARLPHEAPSTLRRVPVIVAPDDRAPLPQPSRLDARPALADAPPQTVTSTIPALLVGPPLRTPAIDTPCLATLLHRAAEAGAKVGAISAAELLRRATRLGDTLPDAATTIAIRAAAPANLLVGLWAAWLTGRVAAPLAADLRADRLIQALAVTGAEVLLHDDNIDPLATDQLRVMHVATLALALSAAATSPAPNRLAARSPRLDAVALILLTSGSTGRAKGVRHSQRTLLAQAAAWQQHQGWTNADVFLNWLPLDHVAALLMFHLQPLYVCADQHHVPPSEVLAQPTRWLDAVASHRTTVTWAPNFAVALLVEALETSLTNPTAGPQGWDLSSLRAVLNGGEAIVPATAARFVALLTTFGMHSDALCPGWGMSETASVCVVRRGCPQVAIPSAGLMPLGTPTPGHAVRIRSMTGQCVTAIDHPEDVEDDATRTLMCGETGLLEVRGPAIMCGYTGAPTHPEDTWLQTGDLARVVDGQLFVVGRADDTLVLHGVNHAPIEIESIALADAAVVSPHVAAFSARRPGDAGAGLVVAVQLVDGSDPAVTARRLRAAIATGTGLQVQQVIAAPATTLPRTALGKVKRGVLRARYEAGDLDAFACLPRRGVWGVWRQVWRPWPALFPADAPFNGVVWVDGDPALTTALVADGLNAQAAPALSTDADGWQDAGPGSSTGAHRCPEAIVLVAGPDPTLATTRAADLARFVGRRWPDARPRWLSAPRKDRKISAAAAHGLLRHLETERPGTSVLHLDGLTDATAERAAAVASLLGAPWRGVQELRRAGSDWLTWQLEPAAERLPAGVAGAGQRIALLGGTGGIGQLLAARLHARGAHVLVLGRAANATAADGRTDDGGSPNRGTGDGAGRSIAFASVDVTEAGALERGLAAWESTAGPMTHLVNLVASPHQGTLDESLPEALTRSPPWAARLAANQAAARAVATRPQARLVDVNSVHAWLPAPGLGAYGAGALAGDATCAALGARATCLVMTAWSGVGLSRARHGDALAVRQGLIPLAAETALAVVEAALEADGGSVWTGLDGGAPNIARRCTTGPLVRVGSLQSDPVRDPFGTVIPVAAEASRSRVTTPPVGASEQRVAAIWATLLESRRIDVNANFFDLGGHSLLIARLRVALQSAFALEVPMVDLFARPTVRAQASWIDAQQAAQKTRGPREPAQ